MQKLLLYAAALLLLASCSKDKSSPRADFTGKVQLVDEFGGSLTDASAVQVTATDVTISNGPQGSVQTTSDGTYSIGGVSHSNQQLSFTKSGYALCQSEVLVPDLNAVVPVPTVVLSPVSSTVATISQIQKAGTQLTITGSVSPVPTAGQPRPHRLYLHRATVAGILQPIALNYDYTVAGTTQPDGTFTDVILLQDLFTAGFRSGDQVRIWPTGDNPKATTYRDLTYQRLVYPAAVPTLSNYKNFFYL